MNDYIACCGLDCEPCEARLATLRDDDALRAKVAAEWSELNHVEITPAMINCTGCRIEGVKTPFCESLCEIRRCAQKSGCETCGVCEGFESCPKLKMITYHSDVAFDNLKRQKRK